jgi:hypothetical protein
VSVLREARVAGPRPQLVWRERVDALRSLLNAFDLGGEGDGGGGGGGGGDDDAGAGAGGGGGGSGDGSERSSGNGGGGSRDDDDGSDEGSGDDGRSEGDVGMRSGREGRSPTTTASPQKLRHSAEVAAAEDAGDA